MNDETKDPNDSPGAEPEDNPWDDDDGGGRTLATDGPTFDLPSNIPSPISNPPPPLVVQPMPMPMPTFGQPGARPKRQPTMIGIPAPAFASGAVPPPVARAPAAAAPAVIAAAAPVLFAPAEAPAPAAPPPVAAPVLAAPAPARAAPGAPPRPPPPLPRGGPLSARAGAPAPPPAPAASPPVASAPRAPSSSRTSVMEQAAAPPAAPPPAAVDDDEDDFPNSSQQPDGPTMAVLSPVSDGPLRDDLLNPRLSRLDSEEAGRRDPSPLGAPAHDKYSDTVSVSGDDPRLPTSQPQRAAVPDLGDESDYQEEPTRTVARDELMRHQDAAFVVADGAMGDEATLAVAPGQIDLGPAAAGIAAALQETLGPPREPSHADHEPPFSPFDAPPHFPPPSNAAGPQQGHMPMSQGHMPMSQAHGPYGPAGPSMNEPQQAPAWQGDGMAYGGPASHGIPPSNQGIPPSNQGMPPSHQGRPHSQGMPYQQGMPPQQAMPYPQGMQPPQGPFGMPPQAHAMGGYPPSGQHPIPPSYQGQPSMGPAGGQGDWGQHAGPSSGHYPGQGGMAAPPQQAPWMQPQPVQGGRASRVTPQILLLIVVGGVCLAIFVTGIVLFLTTKF